MGQRFILRVAPNGIDDPTQLAAFKARLSLYAHMRIIRETAGLTLASQAQQHLECGRQGVILGSLFRRGESGAVGVLTREEQEEIVACRGRRLIDAYWGPYIACVEAGDGSVILLRAPWGELPCYRCERDGALYFASDVDLLAACSGHRPSVAWNAVADHLIDGAFYHRETCLAGIEQCPGGERLTMIDGRELREDLWSPWTFAAQDRQITDRDAASNLVRKATLESVGARASQFDHVMVTLSGGLDSSIVAASLAAVHARFSAMTLVTRDARGDERPYAELVSQALGFSLIATLREAGQIDISRSGARGRPYPCVLAFFAESVRLAEQAAHQQGAQAIFNGGGGDTIFCTIQSGAPAADRLLAEGLGRGFLKTVSDISQFASAGIPAVLRDALARAWFGKSAFRQPKCFELLTDKAKGMGRAELPHPWLSPPPAILPGKVYHASTLVYFKGYVESLDPQSVTPIVAPLLSQPLVEACLMIPSWLWLDSGLNRMVARRAFAGLLPREILARRSKGTPTSFSFEILETHRRAIRSMLVEGQLARQGLINLPGVLEIIDSPRPPSDDEVWRILAFVDVEAWAAEWSTTLG